MVTRAELLKLLASLPPECEGCGAPQDAGVGFCAYCGRYVADATPVVVLDEPLDIRKTNASDDPCPMCQTVHPKDPAAPLICRCLYCGLIAPVAMSTYDPRLGQGVVCHQCCGGAAPRNFQQLEAEALARETSKSPMPWDKPKGDDYPPGWALMDGGGYVKRH